MTPIAGGGSKLLGFGYLLLAGGFFLTGWNILRGGPAVRRTPQGSVPPPGPDADAFGNLGRTAVTLPGKLISKTEETLGEAMRRVTDIGKPKVRTLTVRTIKDRVREIARLVYKGGRDAEIRDIALGIVSRKCGTEWCTPVKDVQAEATAIFNAIVDPASEYAVRYTREHPDVDVFVSARRTIGTRGGDCDDLVIVIASMLMALSHRPELVVMQAAGAKDWSHILLRVKTESSDGVTATGHGGGYFYLDPSMQSGTRSYKPAGWIPPGLDVSLKTGRPAGITAKAKVFTLK